MLEVIRYKIVTLINVIQKVKQLRLALNGTVPSQIKKRGFRLWFVNSHFVRASARLAEESLTSQKTVIQRRKPKNLMQRDNVRLARDLSLSLKMAERCVIQSRRRRISCKTQTCHSEDEVRRISCKTC